MAWASEPAPTPESLEDLARALAREHGAAVRTGAAVRLRGRIRRLSRAMRRLHRRLQEETIPASDPRSRLVEWLLDNEYLVREALEQAREGLPPSFCRRLPKLLASPRRGELRVLRLARSALEEARLELDMDRLAQLLAAYQEVRPLTIGELWALPAALRLALVQELSAVAGAALGIPVDPAPAILPPTDDDAEALERVADCVTALRLLREYEWKLLFERASRVERTLREDPAGAYGRMDFPTRDRYRKAVEELGSGVPESEERAARTAVALSGRASVGGDGRGRHVGFWLVDAGRPELEARLGTRSPARVRLLRWVRSHAGLLYVGALTGVGTAALGLPLALVASSGASPWHMAALGLAALAPSLGIVVSVVHWGIAHLVPPQVLPKLDLSEGVPAEWRTLVAVPCLVTDMADVDELLNRLVVLYHAGGGPNIRFALLTDCPDAPRRAMPADRRLVAALRRGVRRLNRERGGEGGEPFYLLHRGRGWNAAEGCWMGWERKRGKLHQLNRLLLDAPGAEEAFPVREGDPAWLRRVRFVLTLDVDTGLTRDATHRLAGALAHPLNRPEFGPDGAVVAGYTVLQPGLETVPAAEPTVLTRMGEGNSGLDLYSHAVSDAYQDLFGEGIYAGKGIYDVAAFERSLEGRVPENAILSHDLFEGIHGRAGLVTDVQLLEDYPSNVLTYMRRLHRWIRGDWQLLPWLLPKVPAEGGRRLPNRLSALDRWKIVDNLGRSLLAPSLLALLALGWTLPDGSAWAWTALAAAAVAFPTFLGAASATRRALRRGIQTWPVRVWEWRLVGLGTVRALAGETGRWLLGMALLPYEAAVASDAVARTVYRVFVSRRHLLEWTSAAHTARAAGNAGFSDILRRTAVGPALGGLAVLLVVAVRPAGLPAALPVVALWVGSPWMAYAVGVPLRRRRKALSSAERSNLRRLGLRTWLYFERLVESEDHWLPPDNYQVDGEGLVAHRTSPTNIGMMFTGALAAFDLGFIEPLVLAAMTRNTLDAMELLERHRGHFLNWYSTRDLVPLKPRYVSTVDSGNLAASLIALGHGMADAQAAPVLRPEHAEGLRDTLDELSAALREAGLPPGDGALARLARLGEELDRARADPPALALVLGELEERRLLELDEAILTLLDEREDRPDALPLRDLRVWSRKLRQHVRILRRLIGTLLPWLELLPGAPAASWEGRLSPAGETAWRELRDLLRDVPSPRTLGGRCEAAAARLAILRGDLQALGPALGHEEEAVRRWGEAMAEGLDRAGREGRRLARELDTLRARALRLVEEMDFGFLFDPARSLFHIGFDVTAEEPDPHHYDLLASEARLASFLAIAKREVPSDHWVRLGRPFARVGGSSVLMSWGATMFEYLLPTLFTRTPEPSLLSDACRRAVDLQIEYARRLGIPWGISESAYHRMDVHSTYQYRAFGVPELGLRRNLEERVVVAPYASLLALAFRPREVVRNVRRLRRLGVLGTLGLYEAIDFGARDRIRRAEPAVVRAYMAHHQGMILGAIANALCDGVLVRRLHADPAVSGVEYLLHERVPWTVPVRRRPREETRRARARTGPSELRPWTVRDAASHPVAHVLSNGRLTVFVTDGGAGGARWRDRVLTRWSPDPSAEPDGSRVYVIDRETGEHWTAGLEPSRVPPAEAEASFWPHMADYHRHDGGIFTRVRVLVPPEDDVEIRRLTLSNDRARPRRLAVASYGEVSLTPAGEDRRHPAFGKLFVQGAYEPASRTLLFRRRPRSADEPTLFLAHSILVRGEDEPRVGWETDRAAFLGRGGTVRAPAALRRDGPAGRRGEGGTLDPIFSLTCEISLEPYGSRDIAFLTAVAGSREETLARLDRYRSFARLDAAVEHGRRDAEFELRRCGIPPDDGRVLARLLSALVVPRSALRAAPATLEGNRRGQPALWRHGISGDHPILFLRVADPRDAETAVRLVRGHAHWRHLGVPVDLVLLDAASSGYTQPLRDRIIGVVESTGGDDWLGRNAGIHLLSEVGLDPGDRPLLEAAARVVLDTTRGTLEDQLGRLDERPSRLPAFVPFPSAPAVAEHTPPLRRPGPLAFDNSFGGFTEDGREYVVFLEPDRPTPAPWINVLANPEFGCLVSESGFGCTWAGSSAENRLTPWRNDPVCDRPSEALYLRDEETAEVWSPTPLPAGSGTAGGERSAHEVRHGTGYTLFRHNSRGLKQELRAFCPPDAPLKIVELQLSNCWRRARRITATYYAEWVLGPSREISAPHVVPSYDPASAALLARNPFHAHFASRVAFLAASLPPHGLTVDRTEFLGRGGGLSAPAGLDRIGLAGTVRPGLDPCAALQVHLDLAPAETRKIHFVLGQGADEAEAKALLRRYRDPAAVGDAWTRLTRSWDEKLGSVRVRTPEPALDLLVNRWLLYQTVACRLWARTALYQSSGAFGFRDQLQDVMALFEAEPALARSHILAAAGRQFEEGDVLHWWHPHDGTGVRTRCSDDLLWLPFVTAAYVRWTGDSSILDERAPFLAASPLGSQERERYGRFDPGPEVAPLYEHCLRALERGDTAGPHGLPLIGTGDWNDGLDRVGARGRGESIWLGWFLCAALRSFAPLCETRGDEETAEVFRRRAGEIARRMEEAGWDGEWYRRAYDDDGVPLGSATDEECRIDAVSQAWAVLSGAADPERAAVAMRSLERELIRDDERLVLLLAPPFDRTPRDPGYIKGYLPGARENGGQYSHAAVWAAWAFAELGDSATAMRIVRCLAPMLRSGTPEQAARYRVEPYVVAADVHSAPPRVGSGGWTWYTGSAGWLYRLVLEGILGLRREGRELRIEPRLPPEWPGYEADLRVGDSVYRIRVEASGAAPEVAVRITLDGRELSTPRVPLEPDGEEHEVRVVTPAPAVPLPEKTS